jgi:transposase, IS605 OrfB family, central region
MIVKVWVRKLRRRFRRAFTSRLVSGRGFTTPASPHATYSTTPSASHSKGTLAPRYRRVDRDDFLRNNKCAVVGKALQTWDSYQSLREWWKNQDDLDDGKPTPPSTDKSGEYPLVTAHTEDYRPTETNCVHARVSPKPYKKVRGHLRGEPDAMDELRDAITSDDVDVGQAELLYRDGVYYLHVTVTREFDVPEPDTADTVVGVDINERNVALTALDRDTMRTKGTLVLNYERVKQERQRYHTITTRCQDHGKTNIHWKLDNKKERFTEWVLYRLSRATVEFAEQFTNPVIVFKNMSGIRGEIKYGTYMDRRLHKLPFHNFEKFVSYEATWREIPTDMLDAYYNSKMCSCCGERGYRQGQRFQCMNGECDVAQDHADRMRQ